MKIGIVLPSVPGYSETFFTSKIKGLQTNGFEVILFVNNFSTKTALTCEIIPAPKFSKNKFKNTFKGLFHFFKTLLWNYSRVKKLYNLDNKDNQPFSKRIKSILINSHLLSQELDWLHFGFGTMAIDRENVAEAIGAKMAVSFRGFDHYVYPIKHKDCYKKLFGTKVKYHVLSEAMKKDLFTLGVQQKNIFKITPAIDNTLFNKKSLALNNENYFVTVARLHWIKGLDYTLEALQKVKQRGVDFTYCIIGEGVERERLSFAIHQLGLEKNVFLLGKLTREKVKEEMEKATYYIQYSLQEGFCNAALEAQAMGLITIVSDAEGLMENVINDETGFVVPKRNPELLASKILEVMDLERNEKETIVDKAIERIKTNFVIENQIKQFVDFYKN